MSPPALPPLEEIRERLERIFPEGVAGRGALVRELAARTALAALLLGAVGDPDAQGARLLRPSMVTWMSDEALGEGDADEGFRVAFHAAASRGRRSVSMPHRARGIEHEPWYGDNTREPIR